MNKFRVNPEWAKLPLFDRSNWKRVRFGEVVENLNETCDPTEAGIEWFIGLEHLEPGSLHIRTWGNVADGTTFMRRCHPGQVLFGKRRAYQRKVAVAEFDAVVSGDIYVLATKKDRLLPELLPFICLSERFFKFAVETSAGSLSPRTNWSHLAQFEFALPPLDEQRRIADILGSIDGVLEENLKILRAAETYKSVVLEEQFSPARSKRFRLKELCGSTGIRIGPFGSQLHAHEYVEDGVPVVMPANLNADHIETEELKRIPQEKANELTVHKLEVGDVLLARRGDLKKRGFVHEGQKGWICGTGTIRVRLDDADKRRLLFYSLSRPTVSTWLERNAVGTTMPNLNSSIVGNIEVYWPQDPKQAHVLISGVDAALESVENQLTSIRQFVLAVANQIT